MLKVWILFDIWTNWMKCAIKLIFHWLSPPRPMCQSQFKKSHFLSLLSWVCITFFFLTGESTFSGNYLSRHWESQEGKHREGFRLGFDPRPVWACVWLQTEPVNQLWAACHLCRGSAGLICRWGIWRDSANDGHLDMKLICLSLTYHVKPLLRKFWCFFFLWFGKFVT